MVKFLQLFVDIRGGRGIADVRVDLALEGHADAHGLKRFVMNVCGNDGASASDFAAHEFRLNLLAQSDEDHLLGDHALARIMHLRKVPRSIRRCRFRQALLNPSVSNSHNFPLKKSRTAGCLSRCKLSHRGALTATRERAMLSHQTPERQSPDWRVTVCGQKNTNQT